MNYQYAIYARQSLDREGAGLAIARQVEDCVALARRKGLPDEFVVYSDNDVSASGRRRRPGYDDLLQALRANRHIVLVVWHNDRLHRRPVELEEFIAVAEAVRLRIYTVQAGEIDLATPSGRMVARIVGAVARQEVEHKSARRKRANEQRARLGYRSGGTRGFGYGRTVVTDGVAHDRDLLRLNRREAAAIRQAAVRMIAGESTTAIWRSWNAAGLRTPKGRLWEASTFARTMQRPALAGFMVYRGVVLEGVTAKAPAILTEAQLRAIQEVFARPERRSARRQPPRALVDRIATCGGCGEPLRVRLNRGRPRLDGTRRQFMTYSCPAKPVPGHCYSVTHTVDDAVKAVVVEALTRIRRQPGRVDPHESARHGLRMEFAQVQERETRLVTAIAEGLVTPALAQPTLRNIRADRRRISVALGHSTLDRPSDSTDAPTAEAERFLRRLPMTDAQNRPRSEIEAKRALAAEFEALPLAVKQAIVRSTVRVVITPVAHGHDRISVTPL